VVAGGVNENSTLVPHARLNFGALLDGAQHLQLSVAQGDRVLGQQTQVGHVGRPHH